MNVGGLATLGKVTIGRWLCIHTFREFESRKQVGGSLVGPTPVPQYDWLAPFRFAWALPNFNLPRDEFDP